MDAAIEARKQERNKKCETRKTQKATVARRVCRNLERRKAHTELASLKELGFKNFATSGDFVEASRELANCVAV
jgi:hypothetical protein